MFTGIVEKSGVLTAREPRGPGAKLSISTSGRSMTTGPFSSPLVIGESIAVHGVCLTVHTIMGDGFLCDATGETLSRTTLGSIAIGGRLHLERALALGDRLGGHIVTGHIDGKVRLCERETIGDAVKLDFEVGDAELARFVAPKGSVAIDGVSLTVNGVADSKFDVVIIPHTLQVTALGELQPGDESNLEVDLLARYVARLLGSGSSRDADAKDDRLLEKLKAAGFL
jgi:riboflavin synthase